MQGFDPAIPGYHSGLLSAPIRTNLLALYTNNKGDVEPTNKLDGMLWLDSSAPTNVRLKLWRSGTSTWLTIFEKLDTIGLMSIPTSNFVHTQAVTSATWTITHNLGKFPSVTPVNASRVVLSYSSLRYVDINNVEITFSSPQDGYAYLT